MNFHKDVIKLKVKLKLNVKVKAKKIIDFSLTHQKYACEHTDTDSDIHTSTTLKIN